MSEIRKYCENCSHSEYGFAESSLNQYYTCGLVDKIVEEDDTCDKFVHYPTKIKKLESDLQKAEAKIRDLNSKCGHLGIKADNYLQDKIKASERNTLLENEIKELVKHNSRSDEELQEAKKEIGFKEQAIIKAHIEIRDRGKWVKAKNKELKEVKEELSGLQRLYDELVKNGKRLVKDRDKAIECLRFYADDKNWVSNSGKAGYGIGLAIYDFDLENLPNHRTSSRYAGGKKARATLKELGLA